MTKKKIVVAGASGHIGHVVCGLLADRADVVALVNSEDGASKVKAIGINDVHIVDLAKPVNLKALFTLAGAKAAVTAVGNPPLKDEFAGADVFCLITSGDSAEKETNALQAAHDAGIQRVVVLSSETVRLAAELGGKPGPTAAIHGAGEDAAKALFPSYDIVRPTWWSSMHLLPNVGEGLKQGVFMWPGDDTAVAPVHPHDVAEVIAALLLEDASTQRVFELTGPASLTPSAIAAAYSVVLDRPITAPKMTLDEYSDWLVEGAHMSKMVASATAETMRLYAERKGDAPVSDAVFRVTGHQPKSFEDYLAEGIRI